MKPSVCICSFVNGFELPESAERLDLLDLETEDPFELDVFARGIH